MEQANLSFDELFYREPLTLDFEALVLSCSEAVNHLPDAVCYAVRLDDTAFYPEGGGQPSDRGSLGTARVLDVRRDAAGVVHFCDRPLTPGALVHGSVDAARRLDLTQQHSGEHVISGLVHRILGHSNVGFSLSEQQMTLDFDGPISAADLQRIEQAANETVWRNEPIETQCCDASEAKTIEYRSKMDLAGPIRLVRAGRADICACCGLHCGSTGEIGLIKIVGSESCRQGVRLTVLCGGRALAHYGKLLDQARRIGADLSVPPLQLETGVRQLSERLSAETARGRSICRMLNNLRLDRVPVDTEHVFCVLADEDLNQAKYLAKQLAARISGVAMVFLPHARMAGYTYLFVSEHQDVRAFHEQLKAVLKLKGGGNPALVQGVTPQPADEIAAVCSGLALNLDESGADDDGSRRPAVENTGRSGL